MRLSWGQGWNVLVNTQQTLPQSLEKKCNLKDKSRMTLWNGCIVIGQRFAKHIRISLPCIGTPFILLETPSILRVWAQGELELHGLLSIIITVYHNSTS